MKKFKILFFFLMIHLHLNAQNVNNPGFDSIYIGGIDRIFEWITSDAWGVSFFDTVFPMNPNSHYLASGLQYHETVQTVQIEYSGAYDGPFAIKLESVFGKVFNNGTPYRGFIANGNHFYTDSSGFIDLKKGGTPFSFRPYKLIGHFKFVDNSPSMNSHGKAIVLLKKFNTSTQQSDTIGFGESTTELYPTTQWSPFEVPVSYYSSQVPDTIMVAFLSPGLGYSATLWLDSIGFDYSIPSIINDPDASKDVSYYYYQQENKIYFSNADLLKAIKIYNEIGQLIFISNQPSNTCSVSLPAGNLFLVNLIFKNNRNRTIKLVK